MEAKSTYRLTLRKTQLSFIFSQFFDYFSCLFFRRVLDGAGRALFVTACTEHYTIIRIFYDRFLFSLVLFKFVHAKFAVVYACSTGGAFVIVYCWIPRYLVSRNSMICFFSHSFITSHDARCMFEERYITIFKFYYVISLLKTAASER